MKDINNPTPPHGQTVPGGAHPYIERRTMDDIKDRLARAEQNHINLKENFTSFKAEAQEEFQTLSKKIDAMMDAVTGIRMVIAKWLGAGGVLIFVGQLVLDKLIK